MCFITFIYVYMHVHMHMKGHVCCGVYVKARGHLLESVLSFHPVALRD